MGNKRLFGASALWITPSSAALLPWAGHAPQDGGVGGLTDGHGKASGKAVEGKLGGMPRQAPAAGLFAAFTKVHVADSTGFGLPDTLKETFPGAGGSATLAGANVISMAACC